MSRRSKSEEAEPQRKFLIVIDETVECDRAVYYASRRAARTAGKLVMLAVVPVAESNQQWLGVGELMRAEGREDAEKRLDQFAVRARNLAGIDPECVVREGQKAEEIQKLIQEDKAIAVLVLAAGTGSEGPGPLVSLLAGASAGHFPIPITLVPGHLTDAQLDALS
jgi:nucleotide-binding universal stress UspA family protein